MPLKSILAPLIIKFIDILGAGSPKTEIGFYDIAYVKVDVIAIQTIYIVLM